MARRPGRPSKAVLQQALEQDKSTIIGKLQPLRQPVDPAFSPYYQRVLNGDLTALLDYCDVYNEFLDMQHSFLELIGQLVPLQHLGAAKQIIVEIGRRGESLGFPRAVTYRHWYNALKLACKIAREFIRAEYQADTSVKREQLWNPYVDECYTSFSYDDKGGSRPDEIRKWKEWVETPDSQGQEPPSLYELVDRFTTHRLVPKPIFFELAQSSRSSGDPAGRDKRRRNRRFLWTPSYIARKNACAIVGISPSTVSHKNRRK
jgi:hypothetical protein